MALMVFAAIVRSLARLRLSSHPLRRPLTVGVTKAFALKIPSIRNFSATSIFIEAAVGYSQASISQGEIRIEFDGVLVKRYCRRVLTVEVLLVSQRKRF
jgi:hypothetical protein